MFRALLYYDEIGEGRKGANGDKISEKEGFLQPCRKTETSSPAGNQNQPHNKYYSIRHTHMISTATLCR